MIHQQFKYNSQPFSHCFFVVVLFYFIVFSLFFEESQYQNLHHLYCFIFVMNFRIQKTNDFSKTSVSFQVALEYHNQLSLYEEVIPISKVELVLSHYTLDTFLPIKSWIKFVFVLQVSLPIIYFTIDLFQKVGNRTLSSILMSWLDYQKL